MNKKKSLEFKFAYLRGAIVTCWLTNCFFNGICYYFLGRANGTKTATEFVINAAITAFILSLICAPCAALTVKAKHKKAMIPERTYERDGHMLIHFFPRGTCGQVFASAVVVTVLFTFISGGAVIVCGFSGGVPLIQGAILHGVLAGLMGMMNMYLMCVAKVSGFEEEQLEEIVSQAA